LLRTKRPAGEQHPSISLAASPQKRPALGAPRPEKQMLWVVRWDWIARVTGIGTPRG
jgi:hypothetical protein